MAHLGEQCVQRHRGNFDAGTVVVVPTDLPERTVRHETQGARPVGHCRGDHSNAVEIVFANARFEKTHVSRSSFDGHDVTPERRRAQGKRADVRAEVDDPIVLSKEIEEEDLRR